MSIGVVGRGGDLRATPEECSSSAGRRRGVHLQADDRRTLHD
ncbi:MAG: hypothetical protein ACXV98_01665 [Ilumatobacteraceae bacterium]